MATLQYTGVFALLLAEVVAFLFLIVPLPSRWKKGIFSWSSRSPVVQKVLYGIRIAFVFVFVLFADAVMRLRKAQQQRDSNKIIDEHALCQQKVQQFYAQRNTYLTGITMFLGLILVSTHSLIGQILENESQVSTLKQEATSSKTSVDSAEKLQKQLEEARKEIEELSRKDRDVETLKKQAKTTHDEYMRLADECEELKKKLASTGESKKDA
ncbi:B-cell receptor-associated 31-like protein [Martensiomyces pterosporus]|nr:B-cell receptor-associated 31-like protein [Martensiomyces pterosporus]